MTFSSWSSAQQSGPDHTPCLAHDPTPARVERCTTQHRRHRRCTGEKRMGGHSMCMSRASMQSRLKRAIQTVCQPTPHLYNVLYVDSHVSALLRLVDQAVVVEPQWCCILPHHLIHMTKVLKLHNHGVSVGPNPNAGGEGRGCRAGGDLGRIIKGCAAVATRQSCRALYAAANLHQQQETTTSSAHHHHQQRQKTTITTRTKMPFPPWTHLLANCRLMSPPPCGPMMART